MNKYQCIETPSGKALRQKAEIEKSDATDILGPSPCGADYDCLDDLMSEYDNHIASLKEYPIAPEHAEAFTVGGEYVLDSDFQVANDYHCSRHYYNHPDESCDGVVAAIPVVSPAPTKEEDVWEEVKKDYDRFKDSSHVIFFELLKSKYLISKK